MHIVTWRTRVARVLLARHTLLISGLIIVVAGFSMHGLRHARAAINDGLIASYTFDNVSGATVNDGSGNANNGIIHGAAIVSGRVGNAAQFDGVNDDVDVPHKLVTNQNPELSYSFFVKADADSSDKNYLLAHASSGTNNNDCFSVSYDNIAHTVKVLHVNNGNLPVITASADLTHWTHIVVTNSASTNESRVYINGVVYTGIAASCPQTTDTQFLLGRSPWAGYNQYFKGLMDEVRVYDRAITNAEAYELGTNINTNSLAITNPATASKVGGIVSVAASAAGTPTISSVQFYINGVAAGNPDASAPFTYNWDTTTLLQGDYTVSAVGIDLGGNAIPAQVVDVEVDNPPSYAMLGTKSIMQTSTDIVWTTDEPSMDVVEYGKTTDYGQQVAAGAERTYYHKVSLQGLDPGTTYNFRVTSTDNNSNTSQSTNQTMTTITNQSGHEWHVTVDGSAGGDGSLDAPWDLRTALNHPVSVQPGDTIWVHGGVYQGTFSPDLTGTAAAPIIVRNYHNERAIIDGVDAYYPVLSVNGAYTWYWGLEVINSDPTRTTSEPGSNPASVTRGIGFYVESPGSRLINNIIHDTSQGIGFWTPSVNAEAYGNIIYYNGWDGPDRGHGHGIYAQNNTGVKSIENNLVFKNFDFGLHAYTQSGNINNFVIDGNTFFDNGQLSNSGLTQNMLVGGYSISKNPILLNNNTYMPHAYGAGLNIGYEAGCDNATAQGNYIASSNSFSFHHSCTRTDFRNNVFYGGVPGGTASQYPNNDYYSSEPTENYTMLRTNRYETNKAYATVYNWQDQDSVSMNVDDLLSDYDTYEIYDSQNIFGPAIATGTYNGTTLSIPMTTTAQAATVGSTPVAPSHTDREFGNFVIVKTGHESPPAEEANKSVSEGGSNNSGLGILYSAIVGSTRLSSQQVANSVSGNTTDNSQNTPNQSLQKTSLSGMVAPTTKLLPSNSATGRAWVLVATGTIMATVAIVSYRWWARTSNLHDLK